MTLPNQIDTLKEKQVSPDLEWWYGAVIYQVYPRSFYDSNGDGVGDLRGITQKLDYIASLGVDAIWISPFFKSPMKDFGYDVSDYRDVDPLFGTLDDFDELISKAHKLGLKIMIDQVMSHTSDQHAWFKESRSSKDNPKSNWYVWADAKEDGSEPNNWFSIFGGSAWEWDETRQQYYFHNFLKSQPDLNYHCPEVQAQMLKEVEFWLERGVDGLRLDAVNFCFHDQQLRDNPIKPEEERKAHGFTKDNPYAMQYHYYDNTQPENVPFLESLRALMDRYPSTTTLGEINSEDSLATMAEYTSDNKRLHMGYSFELLTDEFSADYISKTVEQLEQRISDGWPCWAISNHDVKRVVSRCAEAGYEDEFAKMSLALITSLRGSICTYQGEELGLTEAIINKEQIQDPYGIWFWPEFKGRDGCRTPMPWRESENNAGFSKAEPWLPIPEDHVKRAVYTQELNRNSILHFFRQLLAWRKTTPALVYGELDAIYAQGELLIIKRSYQKQKLLMCFNLSAKSQPFKLSNQYTLADGVEQSFNFLGDSKELLNMPAYGFLYASTN